MEGSRKAVQDDAGEIRIQALTRSQRPQFVSIFLVHTLLFHSLFPESNLYSLTEYAFTLNSTSVQNVMLIISGEMLNYGYKQCN